MVHVMPDGYPREHLSNRLQGDEVKEGLAIAILLMHRMANLGKPSLKWMPAELLSASDVEINDRKDFLAIGH